MQKVILLFCSIFMVVQAFGDTVIHMEVEQKPIREVMLIKAIEEAKYRIQNEENIIIEMEAQKKKLESEIQKAEEEVQWGSLNIGKVEMDKKDAELAIKKTEEKIALAYAAIQQYIIDIAEAKEDLEAEQANMGVEEGSLEMAMEDKNVLQLEQQVVEAEKSRATEEKVKAEVPASIFCAPMPLSQAALSGVLYDFIRRNHEGHFHSLGCDEGSLSRDCREFAAKSRQQLESIMNLGRGHKPAVYDLAHLSLQNKLEWERYNKCLRDRDEIIRQANIDIASAEDAKKRLEKKMKSAENEIARLGAAIERVAEDKRKVESNLAKVEANKHQQENNIKKQEAIKQKVLKTIEESNVNIDKLEQDLLIAELAKEEANANLSKIDEIIKAANSDIDKAKSEIVVTKETLEELRSGDHFFENG